MAVLGTFWGYFLLFSFFFFRKGNVSIFIATLSYHFFHAFFFPFFLLLFLLTQIECLLIFTFFFALFFLSFFSCVQMRIVSPDVSMNGERKAQLMKISINLYRSHHIPVTKEEEMRNILVICIFV